jgi:hypothetical protein
MHLWCVLYLDLGGVDEDVTGSPEDVDEMKPMVFMDGKDERSQGGCDIQLAYNIRCSGNEIDTTSTVS